MTTKLSIIVPAFDEQNRIGASVEKILAYIRETDLSAELLVVDDGSKDNTKAAAEAVIAKHPEVRARVVRYEQNKGKGFAVRTGLEAAAGDIALFSDADLSTPIEEAPKLVEPIERGEYDVTFGSRALDRSLIGTHQPWRREQGGKVFNLVVRTITGLPFWDTQCGFKAFNMHKFRPLLSLMEIDRFGFDVELLYVAHLHGLRLLEVPVRWNNDDRSKINFASDSLRMIGEVMEIKRNARNGLYRLA